MCLETQIREMAAIGYSRAGIGRALNISPAKIKLICDSLPGICWSAKSQLGRQVCRKSLEHAGGVTAQSRHEEDKYSFRGYEGTLQQLMERFNVEWTVQTVRRRLIEGMSLESAFFSGRTKIRSWYRETVSQATLTRP